MPGHPAPRFVTVGVADEDTKTCYTVPADSTQEALQFLDFIGGGLAGTGTRQILAGATLGPIRDACYRRLAGTVREIAARTAGAPGGAPRR
jgi:hypothetical protein